MHSHDTFAIDEVSSEMEVKILQTLELIHNRIMNIERNLLRLEEKFDLSLAIQRNHLIRIKNKEFISDDMVLYGRPYNDLAPHAAFKIFQNKDIDFIFLDVSHKNFKIPAEIQGSLKIPLEELPKKYTEIVNKTTPILILSEDGIRSILACEFLIKKGHFNINNISGGHKFWPGHPKESSSPQLQENS